MIRLIWFIEGIVGLVNVILIEEMNRTISMGELVWGNVRIVRPKSNCINMSHDECSDPQCQHVLVVTGVNK